MREAEILEQMHGIKYECDRKDTIFYAGCDNFEVEYITDHINAYSRAHYCTLKQQLDCESRAAAEELVGEMSKAEETCPVCGKKAKYKVYTDVDFLLRESFAKRSKR